MKIKVEGLRELDKALSELPKATGKNVLRRVGKAALEPMAASARGKAPDDPATGAPDLRSSIAVSEKRTRRAKAPSTTKFLGGKFRASASTGISIAMGPSSGGGVLNYASFQEFGTVKMPANPFMRPAWDAGAQSALEFVKDNLGAEIKKSADKLARKRAKAGR